MDVVVAAEVFGFLASFPFLLAKFLVTPSDAEAASVGAWGSKPEFLFARNGGVDGLSLEETVGSKPIGKSPFALVGLRAISSSRWGGSSVKYRSSEFMTSAADSVTAEK